MNYYNLHTHCTTDNHTAGIISIHNCLIGRDNPDGFLTYPFFSAGIHPWYIEDVDKQLQQLKTLLESHSQLLLIGEAGLDKLKGAELSLQLTVFERQIALSEAFEKPLLIHCVKAWDELLALHKSVKPRMPWIIHGFRGSAQLAEQLLQHGFRLSFGTRFHPEALRMAWPEHCFAETDDASVSVLTVYRQMAAALSLDEATLKAEIATNFRQLFTL